MSLHKVEYKKIVDPLNIYFLSVEYKIVSFFKGYLESNLHKRHLLWSELEIFDCSW